MSKRTKVILKEYFAAGSLPSADQFAELIDSLEDNNAPTTLTIATDSKGVGSVTRTQRRHIVDTEGQADTDDLGIILGYADGEEIILRIADAARTVVLKANFASANINMATDFTMSTLRHVWHGYYNADDANWHEIARNS